MPADDSLSKRFIPAVKPLVGLIHVSNVKEFLSAVYAVDPVE